MIFAQVLATEFLKLRRSKVTWLSLTVLSFGPLGIALFMWIMKEPGRAAQLGLLGTKANLSGLSATWPAYFSMLTLVVGIGGMLMLSFIIAYVFGREYADGTAKNLLAMPVGRQWFVLAKFVVDRPAVHRDGGTACPDAAPGQLCRGGVHLPGGHRGYDPADAVRRQHPVALRRLHPDPRPGSDGGSQSRQGLRAGDPARPGAVRVISVYGPGRLSGLDRDREEHGYAASSRCDR